MSVVQDQKEPRGSLAIAINAALASRHRISQLATNLGRRIASGEIEPGTLLTVAMASQNSDGGRTSFREAVKVLEGKGLIVSRQGVGTKVAPRESWHLLDPDLIAWQLEAGNVESFLLEVMDFRLIIEPAAAEWAASGAPREPIAKLRDAFNSMRDAHERSPFGEGYMLSDIEFHRRLLTASGNSFLHSMGAVLDIPYRILFMYSAASHNDPLFEQHEALVSYIENGRPLLSRAMITELLNSVKRVLIGKSSASSKA